MTRILSAGLDRAMQARLAVARVLVKHGYTDEVPIPDIATKEKAQRYIGLDPDALKAKKAKFVDKIVPQWIEEARKKNRLASVS